MKKELDRYAMDSKENREKTVKTLFEEAKIHKSAITKKFILLDEYYHNKHYTKEQITQLAAEKGWDFVPPVLPDPFIQVESQIDPLRPEFTFKGRDDDMDSTNAKIRQDVVEFILYNNKLDDLMPENERTLKKLGTACWKVSFDGSITGPGFVGDIVIGGPDGANIFPEKSAYCVDDCEFIDYAYRMHKMKARRTFKNSAKVFDEISTSASQSDTEIYTREQGSIDDDTYQVVEHWYKDDEGDIACSIQIENKEVKFIPKYWKNTRFSGNKMYPLIIYYDIPDNKSFWGTGEIETVWDLVDAADREFLMAILADSFDADDLLIVEENCLKDGTTISKTPGGIVWVKDNRKEGIKRLGDTGSNINALNMIQFIHEKIQETNGNFDSAQGKEPIRVTTSSGIAQLNERANKRSDIKKADRSTGFRRLYELTDWSALEFYNTDRMIMIRGKSKQEKDRSFSFNSDSIRNFDKRKYESMLEQANSGGETITPGENDQALAEQSFYYPRIDTEIITTDGVKQSKAFMTQATNEMSAQLDNPMTPAKAEVVKSQVEMMGLPNEQQIKEAIDQSTQQPMQQPGMMQQQMQQGQQMPQQQQQMHPVDQVLQALTPEQLKHFMSLPQDQQIEMINKTLGGGQRA